MSRGRPRHQSSRRRMYSSRQRDLRERRSHQPIEAYLAFQEQGSAEADQDLEREAPSGWKVQLNTRASAA